MSFGFGAAFEEAFFGGSTSVELSAGTAYPVSLNGIAYLLDTREMKVRHSSVPLLRGAIDDKENVSRQTLNPEAFWRRTFESWHVGAGQSHFDRIDESNPWRFRRSKGVEVFNEKYQLSLLNYTDDKLFTGNTNYKLAVAGGFLYVTDGTALKRTADITVGSPTWVTVTGGTAAAFVDIASDGFNVLLACGTAAGIDKTTRGSATKANHITGATVTSVAYGKGRWIAASGANLYDITTLVVGGGAIGSPLYTQPNTDWVWNSFAEGPTAFYAGGFSGDKSLIYRLTIKEDGTGLNQPVVAGFLPDGELIYSMQGYLGLLLIGTSKGVRVGVIGGNGDVTVSAVIPTDTAVRAFEGQDKYVWFGWTTFEAGNSGLGRLNLETFSNPESLTPAYASDLMPRTADTGPVTSIVTFQDIRVWSSNAVVWAEDTTQLVPTGELDTGTFDYGLTDTKLSLYVDSTRLGTSAGSYAFSLATDGGAFTTIGSVDEAGLQLGTGEQRGQDFELRIILSRDADITLGPVIRSFAMRSEPASRLTEVIEAPLLIAPEVIKADRTTESRDTVAQIDNIRNLRDTKQVVSWTEGDRAWSVVVVDYVLDEYEIYVADDAPMGVNATCLTKMKSVV